MVCYTKECMAAIVNPSVLQLTGLDQTAK